MFLWVLISFLLTVQYIIQTSAYTITINPSTPFPSPGDTISWDIKPAPREATIIGLVLTSASRGNASSIRENLDLRQDESRGFTVPTVPPGPYVLRLLSTSNVLLQDSAQFQIYPPGSTVIPTSTTTLSPPNSLTLQSSSSSSTSSSTEPSTLSGSTSGNPEKSEPSIGAIVGAIVGGILLLLFILLVYRWKAFGGGFFYVGRWRKVGASSEWPNNNQKDFERSQKGQFTTSIFNKQCQQQRSSRDRIEPYTLPPGSSVMLIGANDGDWVEATSTNPSNATVEMEQLKPLSEKTRLIAMQNLNKRPLATTQFTSPSRDMSVGTADTFSIGTRIPITNDIESSAPSPPLPALAPVRNNIAGVSRTEQLRRERERIDREIARLKVEGSSGSMSAVASGSDPTVASNSGSSTNFYASSTAQGDASSMISGAALNSVGASQASGDAVAQLREQIRQIESRQDEELEPPPVYDGPHLSSADLLVGEGASTLVFGNVKTPLP